VVALVCHDRLEKLRLGAGKNPEADGGTVDGIEGRKLVVQAEEVETRRLQVGDGPLVMLLPTIPERDELFAVLLKGMNDVRDVRGTRRAEETINGLGQAVSG
jgi:hypothetical protein